MKQILAHFPDWVAFEESFVDDLAQGLMFNLTDTETGVRYDFAGIENSDYDWVAFERREKVTFLGVDCFVSTKEDLIISKLRWYNITPSEKQMEDLRFLLLDDLLDHDYLQAWTNRLTLNTYGLLGR